MKLEGVVKLIEMAQTFRGWEKAGHRALIEDAAPKLLDLWRDHVDVFPHDHLRPSPSAFGTGNGTSRLAIAEKILIEEVGPDCVPWQVTRRVAEQKIAHAKRVVAWLLEDEKEQRDSESAIAGAASDTEAAQ